MAFSHSLTFLKRYLCNPNLVGAIAPSSRALAAAVCEPYRRHRGPATVLEAGAGTGAITRYIGSILKDEDKLDICEIQSEFAEILENDVLTHPSFARGVAEGRVRLFRLPVQELPEENRYDFVICGLPLTAFEVRDIQEIFSVFRRCLKPGGVFSYYEYVGMRRTSRTLTLGKTRKRYSLVNAYLSDHIRRHQFDQKTVMRNFPPAYAHHLRFDHQMSEAPGADPADDVAMDAWGLTNH